ncbi:hypothetical protein EVAR_99887_1 [Eumeta japonica]|uniref:Uncharacterized protein n=1 Tax=Eumeta variegata TaxID=151549 RepID=A0A4C1ZJL8_EUMVA|nr:hypothetical protein EVAR_99887_1 [Eumeta japonica]
MGSRNAEFGYDPSVFSESDFAPSLVTDIPCAQSITATASAPNNELATVTTPSVNLAISTSIETAPISQSAPTTSVISSVAIITPTTISAAVALAEPETQPIKAFHVPDITGAATTAATSRALPAKVLPSAEVEAATIHTTTMMVSAAPSSPKPGCSTWLINNEIDRRPTTPQQSKFSVASPQQILPLPATRKTSRVTRKRGKTAIITASPYKTELEETIKKKKIWKRVSKKGRKSDN